MYPANVFSQLAPRKLSPGGGGDFRAFCGPTLCYCQPFNIGSSGVTATKGLLWGPWRLALSTQLLIDDQPEFGVAVVQARLPTLLRPGAGQPPLCPPDWQGAGGRGAELLSSLAWTSCPSRSNE